MLLGVIREPGKRQRKREERKQTTTEQIPGRKDQACVILHIEHLLIVVLQFVLTLEFNSDNLEKKSNGFRQAKDGNNNMKLRAAIFGLEKIFRTSIKYVAININIALRTEKRVTGSLIQVTSVPK
jgi:hypothetical protein